jgi:hypothetical protein
MDSGLDSLGAVEFRSSLESRLAVALPPTLVRRGLLLSRFMAEAYDVCWYSSAAPDAVQVLFFTYSCVPASRCMHDSWAYYVGIP